MRILVLDTATPQACMGWVVGDQVVAESRVPIQGKNGETLLLHVDAMLQKAQAKIADADLIVAGRGPGSFTGLRIALATAKAFGLSLRKPVAGVGTLDVIAQGALRADADTVAVVLDAHKERIYGAIFEKRGERLVTLVEPVDIDASEFAAQIAARVPVQERLLVCGPGLEKYRAVMEPMLKNAHFSPDSVVTARSLAALGRARFAQVGPEEALRLDPLYVRPSDALLPASS